MNCQHENAFGTRRKLCYDCGALHPSVTLSDEDFDDARVMGEMRRRSNRAIGQHDNKTEHMDGTFIDILGAAGELAVSIATGMEWTGRYVAQEDLKEWLSKPRPDLGDDVEVRACTQPWHRLLVHRNDPPSWRYVLVHGASEREYNILGWEYGHAIQKEKFWEPRLSYPAFAYPSHLLKPIDAL